MFFDHFDEVRIINLAHRRDRRAEMEEELRALGRGEDPRITFFEALQFADADGFRSPGSRGNYHGHLMLLEGAAAARRSILILEDDVDFTTASMHYRLPEQWSIFYGGYMAVSPDDLPNSDIVGSHFMGFSADIVGRVAKYLRERLDSNDRIGIDGAYVEFRRANPDVLTVFATPQLGYQRPSRSDAAPVKLFDRYAGSRWAADWARSVKRRMSRQ